MFKIGSYLTDFSGNSKEKWVEISSYIKSAISLAKQREDPRAHEAVFKEVPIQRIESQVKEKFKELFQQDPSTSVKVMRDLAVYELVSWFKKDFFKWVDALKCYDGVCNGVPMQATGHGNPTFDEVFMYALHCAYYFICLFTFSYEELLNSKPWLCLIDKNSFEKNDCFFY